MEQKNIRLLTKDDIEVKVKQITAKGALGLLYKTARVDRAILDDTFGPMNWQCKFEVIKENLYCDIGVFNSDIQQWVWKSDCGVESMTEAEKGEASDAFKRAGFKWGIGVELYNAPFIWLKVATVANDKGGYDLADKFERFEVKEIEITPERDITKLVIVDAKSGDVVYSFGSSEKPAEAKQPEQRKPQDIESLRKDALALGAGLAVEDRKKCDDYLHSKFVGDTLATTKDLKYLNYAKVVYGKAKEKEDADIAKKGGNVSLQEADKKGTNGNDDSPF